MRTMMRDGDGGHDEPRAGQEERPQGPGVDVVQVDLRSQAAVVGSRVVPHHSLGTPLTLVLRVAVLEIMASLTFVAAPVIETGNM